MTARAESILATIKTTLTGLTTTGTNVQRGQIYRHEVDKMPALSIMMGADEPAAEYQTGIIDWELTVNVDTVVALDSAYTSLDNALETNLNLMREEIHAALLADPTQGLSYVIDTSPGIASQPILTGEGAEATGSQRIEFVIHYRTSRADIGA